MGPFIRPEGWMNWNRPEAESLVLYAEYRFRGVDVSQRVEWSRQLSEVEAARYYAELRRMRAKYLIP